MYNDIIILLKEIFDVMRKKIIINMHVLQS